MYRHFDGEFKTLKRINPAVNIHGQEPVFVSPVIFVYRFVILFFIMVALIIKELKKAKYIC